jgi:hypothetical protein
MEKYDYFESVKQDILDYITSKDVVFKRKVNEDLYDVIYDELWVADSVTGNASGSYTFNTWQAEENIAHNWDLLEEALSEFGCSDVNVIEKGAEWCDVTIRCYLLAQCLSEVLAGIVEDEYEEWEYEDEDEDEDDE